ncbi:MAG: polysaccharide biosynthesis protein, partial [Bacteroidota bacterium]|nr:polysaccharide biosynthesis protein [Bacteroidota bacterium]
MINFTFIKKFVPRWAILIIDLSISTGALLLAYYLRFNFELKEQYIESFIYVIPLYLTVRLVSFLSSKIYAGVIRYTSTRDALRIFITILLGTIVFMFLNLITFTVGDFFLIPYSVLIIDLAITISTLIVMRLIIKALYFESINGHQFFQNILIYGGDEYGLATKRTLERDPSQKFKIIGFIDNLSHGNFIDGSEVFGANELEKIIVNFNVSLIILAKKLKFPNVEKEIINTCLDNNIKVLRIPQIDDWINGELSFKQIKKLRIEDLLERESIQLDEKKIHQTVLGKTVLVTGAAGSIGSEIVRQLTKYSPKQIILFDQAESPLYDLELEIKEELKFTNVESVIGDVVDDIRMNKLFYSLKPEIVYHEA